MLTIMAQLKVKEEMLDDYIEVTVTAVRRRDERGLNYKNFTLKSVGNINARAIFR